MARIPLFGLGTVSRSPYVTARQMQNMFAERRPSGEKSTLVAYGTPGLNLFVDFGDTPVRGGIEFEALNVDYVVHRGTLWEVNNAGVTTNRGTLSTTSGRVCFAHNGLQVMITDGTYGYIYSTAVGSATPQTITSITRVGTLATMTTTAPHGLVTGQIITVAGATPAAYNGSYTVTVTGANTLTYVMASDPGGSAAPVGAYTITPFVRIPQTGVSAGFPSNPITCCFLAGYFIVNYSMSSRYYWCGLYDGMQWDALDFANAETSPDPIVAVYASGGQLILLGPKTTEFNGLSGVADQPFTPLGGTANEWGLAATWSIAKFDNSFACLIKNRMGEVMIAQMNGYLPKKISTPDVDYTINSYASVSDATAYSYMLGGHPMYVISFPGAGATWMYDGSTGFWSKLKSYGQTRYRAEFSFSLINSTIVADSTNGRLYRIEPSALTDNGDPIEREIIGETVASQDEDQISIDCLRVDMETGIGTTLGQGVNPQIALSISRDNGKTWGPDMWKTAGAIGEYRTRVEWRRLGTPRYFTPKLRLTDPVPMVIVSASINPAN